jgi:alpha,alpha-trehalase
MHLDAAILDVDGVLTRTATVHERAWKALLDPVLEEHGADRPFSRQDYLDHVDGKPRLDGLRDLLSSRHIAVADDELQELAARKNKVFRRLLDEVGVEVFDDAVEQVRRWRQHGLAIAFVSASRNARDILRAAGLDELCDIRIDGETALQDELFGKSAMFREAARRLKTEPGKAFVVEDAVAGVEAAAEAGFALVVGVARNGDSRALAEHGAHRVVHGLDELADLVEPGSRPTSELPSALRFEEFEACLDNRDPVMLLDFDGTLAPIVKWPHDAAIDEETRETLRALAERCTVAIVSGRDREDVARRVGLPKLWYVGSHGFDIGSPSGRRFTRDDAEPARTRLKALEAYLRQELEALEGIVVEPKAYAIAVHYRVAREPDADRAMRLVEEIAKSEPHLRVHRDRRVIELQPDVDWNKGHATKHILDALHLAEDELLPIYIGDGRTDEDAFRVLRHRGRGILVGAPPRPTHADLRLDRQEDVVTFLKQVIAWHDATRDRAVWTFRHEGFLPEREGHREALYTLGNGNFATRGAAEEATADDIHYPGTYLAGGYNRLGTELHGELLINEDLVNWPNWLRLSFRPAGGEWLSLSLFEVLELSQELDLRRGVLRRRMRVKDRSGRITILHSRRLVSMDDPSIAALTWELTPENWSGPMEIRTGLDGTVCNNGVQRYRQLRGQHLVPEGAGAEGDSMWLAVRTRQSWIRMAQVARTIIHAEDHAHLSRHNEAHPDRVEQHLALDVVHGEPLRVEKVVVLKTSRDPAISEPLEDAQERMRRTPGFDSLLAAQGRRWAELWHRCDIRLAKDREAENRILRLHVFHVLQVVSPHIVHRDTGVPARGLHGEAYRGHVFWDELFIFPFLNLRIPELTRELLMYRYLRLDMARNIARQLGYEGAAFPWQSGSNGREESQVLHLNPRSGRWVPDETLRQRHISAAVAWNVWHYFDVTADQDFLSYYGVEILVEVARFWGSIAEWDEGLARYRIRSVMGPDEFHTRYPDSERPGLDDNTYTNVMASWCLRTAERALRALSRNRREEVLEQLGISETDRQRWQEIASKLRVVFHDGHILSQFDGYAELEELDWQAYEKRYGDIQRLDRILEAEGDSPNRYKASKQADVLMLFFLFSDEELSEQLAWMGYEFDPAWTRENIDYYLQRTSHGSTLSGLIHSWVLARHDRAHSWRIFQKSLQADVADVQGGTTAEGIHMGAMAGTIDMVQRGYTGATVRDGVLWLDPQLPEELSELSQRLRFRGAWIELTITHDKLEVELASGETATARVGVQGQVEELLCGQRRVFPLREQDRRG